MEGDAAYWQDTMMQQMMIPNPPLWTGDWILFKQEFLTRFGDPRNQEKALDLIMSNKVLQTTTAWKFFDLVRETCQRASWDTPEQWRAVAKRGLKKDLAIAMAGRYPVRWNDFTTLVIEVDEELQALKGQDSNTQSKKGTNTTNTNTNCTQEKCPDNSKFKLTDKE